MNRLKAIVIDEFKRVGLWVLIVIFVIGAIFLYWFGFGLKGSESDRLKTIAIGDQIVHILKQYYAEHNRYPDQLSEVGSISAPAWGEDWEYKTYSNGKSFSLCVGYKDYGEASYPVMCYDPNGWIYDN